MSPPRFYRADDSIVSVPPNSELSLDRSKKRPNPPTPGAHTSLTPTTDGYFPEIWGVGWQCPASIIGLFLCGIGCTVGHHLFYKRYDNTLARSENQQVWVFRFGTGLAFLVKLFFGTAIGGAAEQLIWATLRQKSVRILGIDAMFSVLNNPFAFLVRDIWISAKTLTLVAVISWLIGLSALITPATLSVTSRTTTNISLVTVPTVNFTDSFINGWKIGEGVDYISSPSPFISRLFTATLTSASHVPYSLLPFPDSSYTLQFLGPSYKCQELSEAMLEMEGMTFNDRRGERNYSSLREVWGDLMSGSNIPYKGGAPYFLNNVLLVSAGWAANNLSSIRNTNLVCQLWTTSYALEVRLTNGAQTLVPLSIKPVAIANFSSPWLKNDPYMTYTQEPDFIDGYYVIHLLFTRLIRESLQLSAPGLILGDVTGMPFTQSGLFDCPEVWNSSEITRATLNTGPKTSCRNWTLARALEDLSRNFTYSLLIQRSPLLFTRKRISIAIIPKTC
ncbi:hypothetical protein FQN57_003548 [Myotisia sp. PD_48]|nr:hypothetical protein FQN57_003548 [Myotisia sp. PD_48]